MAKIRIKRTNEWINKARQIGIYLDNQKIGAVSSGETKEFDVPSGQHKVRAKIDWCGSKDLTCQINEKEVKTITISGFKYADYSIIGFFVPFAIYSLLKVFFNTDSSLLAITSLCISIILLFGLTYYLTFGRNSYLRIKENQTDTE
jgi:hypothetical protein